jgi:hypothetical protein
MALDQLDTFVRSYGPFDGVVDFSHGTQLAVTFVVDKGLEGAVIAAPFKCAILFSPLGIYDLRKWLATGRVQELIVQDSVPAIGIPALVVEKIKEP